MQPHDPHLDDQEEWTEDHRPAIVKRTWVGSARSLALKHWQPRELAPPTVDPAFHEFGAVERSAEVFRHNLHCFEYWLSPKGWLREWIRFNLRIAAIIATPTLLVVPLITFALRQIDAWVKLILDSTSNLVLFPLSALMVVGLISALVHRRLLN
jgi:hypothetical protein